MGKAREGMQAQVIVMLNEHLGRIGAASCEALGLPVAGQAVFPLVQEVIARLAAARAGVAAAEARGRAAERERCAGMVREMAREFELGADDAYSDISAADDDVPAFVLVERGLARSEAHKRMRDLAERIGKGE